ncbi:alpha/beta fold hydrolase [Kutzneria sp. NPDC051319]|uniref:alpha/beta fold hydrolase n=1 Tax=Kutzneria sp. NPDC051319 TaxID=3155047 RepID=UPI00343DBA1D
MLRTVVDLAAADRFEELADRFTPELRAAASADLVRLAWAKEVGELRSVGEPVGLGSGTFSVRLNGNVDLFASFDEQGQVSGLRLAAAAQWTPPPYARPRLFTETEVLVGQRPGTLALPRKGNGVGVVLLSGGGPFDRDGTAGAMKPLKDLAWGLAARGVASVRFDKPVNAPTLTEEYVPHAVAGVELLREHVDRVFVVGHSAGGKVAPKVALAAPAVSGLVLMAADTQPMTDTAVRVGRRLGQDLTEVAARTAAVTADTPDGELLFGFPATYWLELKAYDQVAVAIEADRPMLVLQGGRDYQVTVEDDLPAWRRVPRAETRILPELDHMFFPDNGSHVDEQVIEDIAAWVSSPVGG